MNEHLLQSLLELDVQRHPARSPLIPSLPTTSDDRLAEASTDEASQSDTNTVLYLAYGSNLSAETFLGARGIRPLSQINVSVPMLRLVFNVPGLPYVEPCFANTALRKVPKQPIPDPRDPLPRPPPIKDPEDPSDPVWDQGLIGVVYEVTQGDYKKIIATEGGGASYLDILVPCFVIPPRMSVPEKPPVPEFPKPFLAHTLFMPDIPDAPPGNPDDPDRPEPEKKWWWRFVRNPMRPTPDYAQPSERYATLLRHGAAEHDLPGDYQEYLDALRCYTITSRRQDIGRIIMTWTFKLFMAVARPLMLRFADEHGRLPTWGIVVLSVWFNVIWLSYDYVLKPLFGDGERTEIRHGESVRGAFGAGRGREADEEKAALLGGFEP